MDPISVGLLAAIAGGAGGEMGKQAWASLTALVRKPLRHTRTGPAQPGVSVGENELVALQNRPGDLALAQRLSTALAVRSTLDQDFALALTAWLAQAARIEPEMPQDNSVTNTISGGTFHGPVVMGRNIAHINGPDPSGQPDHGPA
ncbi:hypothetical protein [Actinospica robiniae]|uniref:hypothetical protein n=1 Tax=Actinospica robiniae TaxID=304901 RepID=UPI0003F4CE82|nr:hypothetical protein [Actinospica robiniae]